MNDLDINEMLRPDGIVPIDRATTQALVRECFKLRKERRLGAAYNYPSPLPCDYRQR